MAITVEKKYRALRSISLVLKICAIVVLILGIVVAASSMASTEKQFESRHVAVPGFFTLILSIMAAIGLWAWAELIKLLIDVEENTRKTHVLVERERA